MKKKGVTFGTFLLFVFLLGIVGFTKVAEISSFVINSAKSSIVSLEDAAAFEADCILVLGCGVRGDQPTMLLRHRIDLGIDLYKAGAAPRLLMSGDHGQVNYDEVNVMKNRAVDYGVPSGDIFMDHAGFSTYESLIRAKEIFQIKRIVIVTQEYHLYRAVYLARALGLEVCGVSAYSPFGPFSTASNEAREILARNKDYFFAILKPKPTYLGDVIPISGSGDLTNG